MVRVGVLLDIEYIGSLFNCDGRIFRDLFRMGTVHLDGPVIVHGLSVIVLDCCPHVVLAVDGDLLLARGVIHGHLVISFPFMGIGLEPTHYLLVWQFICRHCLWIPDAATNHRLVWVTLDKGDDYLLSDARNVDAAPLLSSPEGAYSQPA